jgi:hypothetical protein
MIIFGFTYVGVMLAMVGFSIGNKLDRIATALEKRQ